MDIKRTTAYAVVLRVKTKAFQAAARKAFVA
jgi:hypothetical protein